MGDAIPVTLQSLHRSISLQKEDFVNCMLCGHRVILSMSTMTVLMLEDIERSPNDVSIFISQTTPMDTSRRKICDAIIITQESSNKAQLCTFPY